MDMGRAEGIVKDGSVHGSPRREGWVWRCSMARMSSRHAEASGALGPRALGGGGGPGGG